MRVRATVRGVPDRARGAGLAKVAPPGGRVRCLRAAPQDALGLLALQRLSGNRAVQRRLADPSASPAPLTQAPVRVARDRSRLPDWDPAGPRETRKPRSGRAPEPPRRLRVRSWTSRIVPGDLAKGARREHRIGWSRAYRGDTLEVTAKLPALPKDVRTQTSLGSGFGVNAPDRPELRGWRFGDARWIDDHTVRWTVVLGEVGEPPKTEEPPEGGPPGTTVSFDIGGADLEDSTHAEFVTIAHTKEDQAILDLRDDTLRLAADLLPQVREYATLWLTAGLAADLQAPRPRTDEATRRRNYEVALGGNMLWALAVLFPECIPLALGMSLVGAAVGSGAAAREPKDETPPPLDIPGRLTWARDQLAETSNAQAITTRMGKRVARDLITFPERTGKFVKDPEERRRRLWETMFRRAKYESSDDLRQEILTNIVIAWNRYQSGGGMVDPKDTSFFDVVEYEPQLLTPWTGFEIGAPWL